MADQNSVTDEVEAAEQSRRDKATAEEIARRGQFTQSGDMLDTTIGNMGGAGASGSGPDIARQSAPASINSSDLPGK